MGDKAVQNDYWKTATVAEVQRLQGNVEAALVLYRAAVVAAPLARGSHESTFSQPQLLLKALDATAEQQAKIAPAFHPFLSQE